MTGLDLPAAKVVEPELDWAAVENARLVNEVRAALLRSRTAVTAEQISEATHKSPETVRRWVQRARDEARLVAVKYRTHLLVPSFLLTTGFDDVNPDAEPSVQRLLSYGLDGWSVWDWFVTPNTWLDGDRPTDRLAADDVLALEAAVGGLIQE